MAQTAAILEHNHNRILEMEAVLADVLPGVAHSFFDNSQEMIAWLKENLVDVVLLSLDHDLPIVQYRNGIRIDPGSGREVAEYLATIPPICPVIVHTINVQCGDGMEQVLNDSGWPTRRVNPFGEYEWIRKAWAREVQSLADDGWFRTE